MHGIIPVQLVSAIIKDMNEFMSDCIFYVLLIHNMIFAYDNLGI